MPSGKVHALATCVTAGVLTPLVYIATQSLPTALAFTGGCVIGLVVTPDLDVRDRDTHAGRMFFIRTIMRRSGSCQGAIWDFLWLPYAWLIPCHRHPLSHWPILGTALRLVYLLAVPTILWWGMGQLLPLPTLPRLVLTPLTGWAIDGLTLVDALHWGMDRAF